MSDILILHCLSNTNMSDVLELPDRSCATSSQIVISNNNDPPLSRLSFRK